MNEIEHLWTGDLEQRLALQACLHSIRDMNADVLPALESMLDATAHAIQAIECIPIGTLDDDTAIEVTELHLRQHKLFMVLSAAQRALT